MHTSATRTLRGPLKDGIFSFNPDAISSQPAFIPIIAIISSKLCELDECLYFVKWTLGTPFRTKSSVFLNIVQTAFDPPLVFEHLCCGFF